MSIDVEVVPLGSLPRSEKKTRAFSTSAQMTAFARTREAGLDAVNLENLTGALFQRLPRRKKFVPALHFRRVLYNEKKRL